MANSSAPLALDPQARRARQFIVAFLPAVAGFGLLFTATGLIVGEAGLCGAGVVILCYGAALVAARRLVERGEDQRAVTVSYGGMLAAALLIVPLQPGLFPTLGMVPFIAAALALPYRAGRDLTRLIALCCLASLAAMGLGQILIAADYGEPALPVALSISSYGAAAAFVSLLLWQFSRRLMESLAESRAATRTLEEAREIERQMVEAQKFESLGVLAGGIAHDFNNLLGVIVGHADLARAGVAPGDEAARSLEEITLAARRGAALTAQMLAYAGRSRVELGAVDVNAVVAEAAALAGVGLAAGTVRCELAEALPAIHGDVDQIRQLALNLTLNAVEAPPGRGGVVVRTALLAEPPPPLPMSSRFLPDHQRSVVCIEVSDDGPGMRPEILQRVCEPFFSTKFTGRGLGLAAALGIVRGHGGALEAESEPGRGSRFRVLLRSLAASPGARLTPPRIEPAPLMAMARTILVIEDDESVRSLVRRILVRAGYTVAEAGDGAAGLALLAAGQEEIACVLTDLIMPLMSGDRVAEAIAAHRPDLPVVLMSGYDGPAIEARFAGLAVAGVLQKPFSPEELLARLEEAIGRR